MTAVIAWTCKLCGHHAEGLSVLQYMAAERDHVCQVANIIRRAIPHLRSQGPTGYATAEWLEAAARQADGMTDPFDFSTCDEPSSVQHALAVARTIPWENT